MGWIDIVFIVLIVLFAIIGLAKGLFDSILSIFSSVLSIIAAILASKYVAAFLNNITHCNDFFAKKIVEWGWVGDNGLEIFGKVFTPGQLANTITIILSIIAVWLLIKLAIALLSKLFDNVTSSSNAMSGLNRVLGLVFGAAKGVLIACLGFALVSVVTVFIPNVSEKVKTEMEKNKMSGFFYTYVNEWVGESLEKRIDDILGKGTTPTPEAGGETGGEENTPENGGEVTPTPTPVTALRLVDTRTFGLQLV